MRLNMTSTGTSAASEASEARLATTNSGVTTSPERGREAKSTWASTLLAVTSATTSRAAASMIRGWLTAV